MQAKYSNSVLSLAVLSVLSTDAANPRPEQFRNHNDIARSMAVSGYAPKVDAITGISDHPVIRYNGSRKLADALKTPAKGEFTILRGNHRLGTLKSATSKELPKGLSADDKAVIASLVDTGKVQVVIVECDDDTAASIATDDDALKRKWSPAHRFIQWMRLVSTGMPKESAYHAVGYTSRYQHFERLEKLGPVVQQAWINGKTDATKPQLTDKDIMDIHALQKDTGKGATTLVGEAKEKFDSIMSGNTVARATTLSDKEMQKLASSLVGSPFHDLLQIVRGYDPKDAHILTAAGRGALINEFVAANGRTIGLPADDATLANGSPPIEPSPKAKGKGKKVTA